MSDKQLPIHKLKSYPMNVAIWRFADKDTNYPRYSIKLTKTIKDKETGDYVDKSFLQPQDAAVASVLLAQAFAYVTSLPNDKL